MTLEIENVAVAPLEALLERTTVYPPPRAVAAAQDRLAEKTLFRSLGIPTTQFVVVDGERDLGVAARELGWPLVLKTRRMGYDGRGQRVVSIPTPRSRPRGASSAECPSIAEQWVRFVREVSLIAVQGANGERAFYPLAENVHRDGILARTVAPYVDASLQAHAERWLGAIAGRARLLRRAHGRVLSDRARLARERDGAACPQLRSLDDRRR